MNDFQKGGLSGLIIGIVTGFLACCIMIITADSTYLDGHKDAMRGKKVYQIEVDTLISMDTIWIDIRDKDLHKD